MHKLYLLAACLLAIPQVSDANVIYSFTPYVVGGFAIDSGTITTTPTASADGILDLAEIVSYSLSYTHPTGSAIMTEADSTVFIEGSVSITPTQILIADLSPDVHFNRLTIDDDSPYAFVHWTTTNDFSGDAQLITMQEPDGIQVEASFLPSGSIEVATVIPEPSAAALFLTFGVLLTLWYRFRK